VGAVAGVNDWLSCPYTSALLQRLDSELRLAVETQEVQLGAMVAQAVSGGGKRLRPALLFIAASFGHASDKKLLHAAAALELMHVASLYHDDVMDHAMMRRHAPSANVRWGNGFATLTGTFLLARATALLSGLGETANRFAAAATVALSTGQLHELDNAYNTELSQTRRIDILRRKTATLFELPCQLGAHLSGSDITRALTLTAYGRDLGLAFQLADDALDLAGDPEETGKAIGTDIRQGIYSIPIVRALRRRDARARQLHELLTRVRLNDREVSCAVTLVRASGTIGEVLGLARASATRAIRRLASLPKGAARRSLNALAEYAVARTH
jgi:geranylgeranyl pyrophosphate synthase